MEKNDSAPVPIKPVQKTEDEMSYVHPVREQLYLVDLDQNLPGFKRFVSSWIYMAQKRTIVVDPGPASTIPLLVKALKALHVNWLSYILLTHIHIDHAGGAGLLLRYFPEAKIICHPKGIPHMINPEKLWAGSRKVLGEEVAQAYGPVAPVPEKVITFSDHLEKGGLSIDVHETPGHAAHHVNYLVDGLLFAGEVAGVNIPLEEGFYLRIATPPRFIYEVYKASLKKAAALPCTTVCFGHYGLHSDPVHVFNAAQAQLELWMKVCRDRISENPHVKEDVILDQLLADDPSLKAFENLSPEVQQRERYFCKNSLRGILAYLTDKA